ncbi:hypothetical protein [Terracidiphilus gabretensis]|uniref:hypothetical protein n=1 Tax=Terracidiphilus gabretensis TaxID=1577687 RepID=UPI00071B477C|nr:hypothetical protein [Terracidiphilus gabretensis]
MKLYLTRIACLLSLVLTSCVHKNQAANQLPLAPPIEDAPLPKPDVAQKDQLPPTVVTPAQPEQPATASQTDQPKPPPRRKKPVPKPANGTSSQASNSSSAPGATSPSQPAPNSPPPTLQAANGTPDETSAIGKLSSGEPADLRAQTVSSLNGTEHGLNTLNRKLSDTEEKTSAQIKEYIKQARTALASNDLDGANTLATKAQLLLNELKQDQ